MKHNEIRDRVIQALAKCLTRAPETLREDDKLIGDLGLDSLDFLDLMFALEKSFGVRIRDEDFDRLLKPTQQETRSPQLSPEEIEVMGHFIPSLLQTTDPVPRNSVMSMMTTASLVNMVAYKLSQRDSSHAA